MKREGDYVVQIRPIKETDNAVLAKIIRQTLEIYHLDIPGTAYYDTELDHLSDYYSEKPNQRVYLVAVSDMDEVLGGIGLAEFESFDACAEIQKLYLTPGAQGQGIAKELLDALEGQAKKLGYQKLYLETHSILEGAIRFYKKHHFEEIECPEYSVHSAMDRFFLKNIG